jgi:hypothetical protein
MVDDRKEARVTERLEWVGDPEQTDPDKPGAHAGEPAAGPVDDSSTPADTPADLALFVPERISRLIEARRAAWTPVDTVAAWLVGAHLVLLAVIVGRGALYLDDLRAQGYAVHQPFWQFIVASNGTHFAPIPRILDWTQSRWFPLEHTPATVITLLVRLLLALGFWRVLRRLFGARPATLVPLAVLLFTPALIPATTWYRQSITVLACTVAMVWAVDAQLRWVLYRNRADLVTVVLVTAVGLGCYEKAAMIPVILLGLTVALFATRRRARDAEPGGLERPVRAGLLAVVASGVVVLVFLLIYRSGPYDQGGTSTLTLTNLAELTWDTVRRTMVPMLLGGPYHWVFPVKYVGTAALSTTAIVFCLVIALLGLLVVFRRGPGRTLRALLLLLVWLVPSVLIVAVGRFANYGLTLADAARLWSDLVPAFLLAAALAALPWTVGAASRSVAPQHRSPRPAGGPLEITVPAIAGALVLAVVLGGSVLSSLTFASRWWDNPTGQWIANARLSMVNAEPYPRMLATPLPTELMPTWVAVTFPTDAPLLLLLRPDTRFYDGDSTPKVLDASGVRTAYVPVVSTQTKDAGVCLAGLNTPATVRFPKPAVYVPGAQVEIGLLLAEATKIEVKVVTSYGTVLTPQRFSDDELPAGPHRMQFPVPLGQTITAVQVTASAHQATSCVHDARVWAPTT